MILRVSFRVFSVRHQHDRQMFYPIHYRIPLGSVIKWPLCHVSYWILLHCCSPCLAPQPSTLAVSKITSHDLTKHTWNLLESLIGLALLTLRSVLQYRGWWLELWDRRYLLHLIQRRLLSPSNLSFVKLKGCCIVWHFQWVSPGRTR